MPASQRIFLTALALATVCSCTRAPPPAKPARSLQQKVVSIVDRAGLVPLEQSLLALSDAVGTELGAGASDRAGYERRITDLAAGVDRSTQQSTPTRIKVVHLVARVYEAWSISPSPDDGALARLFPDRVLAGRSGSCVGLSGLFVIAGERLGLDIGAVLVPGHMFVRWKDRGDSSNLETLRNGLARTDDFYRDYFRVPYQSATYMRPLTRRELVAVYVYNTANLLRDSGRTADAVALFELAATILPGSVECRGNLGVEYMRAGRYDEAETEFRAAVVADPAESGAYLNLATALLQAGRHGEATSTLRTGLAFVHDASEIRDALIRLRPEVQ